MVRYMSQYRGYHPLHIHVAGNLLEGPQVWFDMYCGAKLLDGAKLLWCARGPSGQRLFAATVGTVAGAMPRDVT